MHRVTGLARGIVVGLIVLVTACSSGDSASPATIGASTTSATAETGGPMRITYGDSASQYSDLYVPEGATAALPVVVLIHGGFWRAQYGLDLMQPLAADLVDRGYAVLNVEYRRVGEAGGGYPGTLADVAAAIDSLTLSSVALDLDDVVIVGHSAGGHLALWAAGRATLPAGAPGANPLVVPRLAIGQGPVFDLAAGDAAGLGGGAVTDFIGGSVADVPDRYAIATPSTTSGVALAVVRGGNDDIVPAAFTVPTPVGDVRVVDVPGEDHFDLIDPASESWAAVIALIGG